MHSHACASVGAWRAWSPHLVFTRSLSAPPRCRTRSSPRCYLPIPADPRISSLVVVAVVCGWRACFDGARDGNARCAYFFSARPYLAVMKVMHAVAQAHGLSDLRLARGNRWQTRSCARRAGTVISLADCRTLWRLTVCGASHCMVSVSLSAFWFVKSLW